MAIEFTSLSTSQALNRGRTTDANSASATKPTPAATAQATASAPAAKGDVVSFSDAAVALQKAEKQLASTPDVDLERVAEIKAKIADGSYEINARNIAEGMLQHEALLN